MGKKYSNCWTSVKGAIKLPQVLAKQGMCAEDCNFYVPLAFKHCTYSAIVYLPIVLYFIA